MEPTGTKDVAGGEHDYECNQIERRLVGEENVRLDSDSNPVNSTSRCFCGRSPTPRLLQPLCGIVPLLQHLS